MDDLIKKSNSMSDIKQEETYKSIRGCILDAQKKVCSAVNIAMVTAYWEIGEQIFKACGDNSRAEYGKQLLQYISEKMMDEFGKGYTVRNLQMMRKFYLTFPNANALRSELSWTHYRSLIRVYDEKARLFYMDEAVKAGWSSRQLDRQINTMYYQRILASKNKDAVAQEIEMTDLRRPDPGKILLYKRADE